MSFGKRGSGEGHPARNLLPPEPVATSGEPIVSARMKVTNPGAIDKGFIGLAVGVVLLSAGAAFAAPSLFSMFSSIPVRPITEVVAGLDRNHAKTALALEAFPDSEGHAFMEALAKNFPESHDRLLGRLADAALTGGDRDDLVRAYNAWSMEFILPNLDALGRTGAEGFDKTVGIVTDAMNVVEHTAGGCDLNAFEKMSANPKALFDLGRYGQDGYKVGMKTGRVMVDLIAKGKSAQPVSAEITREDERALTSTFFGMMMDPQVMGLIQAASMAGSRANAEAMASSINVCQLARTVIVKLKDLPGDTKAHIMALGGQNAGMLLRGGGLGQLMNGGMPGANFPGGFPSGLGGAPTGFPTNFQPAGLTADMLGGGPRVTFSPKLGSALGGH